jgi:hypothetical protein
MGVVACIMIILTVNYLKKHVVHVSDRVSDGIDQIKESTLNMNEMGFNVFSLLSPFIFAKKKRGNTFTKILKAFFNQD